MIKEDEFVVAFFRFSNQNIARMWVAVHESVDENHIWVQLADLIGDVECVDFILVNVFQVIDLATG